MIFLIAQTPVTQTKTSEPKRTKKTGSYRVPVEAVYGVLSAATKEHLERVHDAWEELMSMLSVTQRALVKASEVVAASPKGIVMAFDYEILCQKVNQDVELQQTIRQGMNRLIQYEPELITIPKNEWGTLRKNYINQMNDQDMPSDEKPPTQGNPVVDEAKELFGSLVDVVDD